MTIRRAIATAAALTGLAGLAIGTAGIACAAPTLSGHYFMTVSSDAGPVNSGDWYFTPCGDGCAQVAVTSGGQPFGQAQFRDGQWTLVWHSDVICPNGTRIPGALSSYATWDPVTLAGKDESGPVMEVCEYTAKPRVTNNLQLTPAG